MINLLYAIPAFITIFSAYNTFSNSSFRHKYSLGVWTILKYNPISLILFIFIVKDISKKSFFAFEKQSILLIIIQSLMCFILAIILMIRVSKYNKSEKVAALSLVTANQNLESNFKMNFEQKRMSSTDAMKKLKLAKEKLDLQLISQEDYDHEKENLRKYIE
jgi:hypothetical protein